MWSIRKLILEYIMKQGLNVIIDETNTTKARRAPIIKLAQKYGYRTEGIWIDTSAEICTKRAEAEGDQVIIPTIKRMAEQFEAPTTDEFDWLEKWPIDDLRSK